MFNGWTDGGCIYGQNERQTQQKIDGLTARRMDGWMDGMI